MIEVLRRISNITLGEVKRYYSMESKHCMNFLNGQRVSPSQAMRSIEKFNPATGSFMFDLLCSGQDDVNKAVNSAKEALKEWSKMCPRTRGQFLLSAANQIRMKLENIATAEVIDTGKPIWEARLDIAGCADSLEYFGGIAASISGSHHQLPDGSFAMVQREPLGVVAGIGAWNYPFQVMAWKAAPALVCGNTFVYKPSEFTPTTSVVLAEIFTEVGLPHGVVNVVQGGYETGEYICAHPEVSKVTFTGSVSTGQKIVKSCADTMKKVTMELGGKSALLVFSDCDIVNAVKATLLGNFLTQDTYVGAVINENHGNKIMNFIDAARKEGATIACGGERVVPDQKDLKGFFISPCVLTNCKDEMTVVKEEIFGPVVSLLPFDCEDEAITRANASPYGLAAGVMTKDIQRAHRVASALQAGIVWINNYNIFPPEVPFGGYKLSGFGRENGMAAINDFSQLKTN